MNTKKLMIVLLAGLILVGCGKKADPEVDAIAGLGAGEVGATLESEDKTNEVDVEDLESKNPNESDSSDDSSSEEDKSSGGDKVVANDSKPTTSTKPSGNTGSGTTGTTSKPSASTNTNTNTSTKPSGNTGSTSNTGSTGSTSSNTGGTSKPNTNTNTNTNTTKPAETTPSSPTQTTPSTPDGKKIISRVLERKTDLAVKRVPNANMYTGEEKVITEGKPRESWRITYEIWENGRVIQSGSELETVAGVAKVIEYGTKFKGSDPYFMNHSHNVSIMNLVNKNRAANGLVELQYGGAGLQAEADRRVKIISDQWFNTGNITHDGARESENIQCGNISAADISRGFDNSPGHAYTRNEVGVWRFYASSTYVDHRGVGCNVEVFSTVNK